MKRGPRRLLVAGIACSLRGSIGTWRLYLGSFAGARAFWEGGSRARLFLLPEQVSWTARSPAASMDLLDLLVSPKGGPSPKHSPQRC